MWTRLSCLTALFAAFILGVSGVFAQETVADPSSEPTPESVPTEEAVILPGSWRLNGINFEYQKWNNCGPATLTNALTYFGYTDNQDRAAIWLKPNGEDKNVSPDQMVAFVNSQVPELQVFAEARYGGTLETLKMLLFNNFPVIIEAGYDPEPHDLGWMGHYLLVTGYDDAQGIFYTHDSYIGADKTYTYEHVQEFWQHFNYTYIVLYTLDRDAELQTILATNADERQNAINALEIARAEAVADQANKWAWFNMGTNFVALDMYEEAATAYDRAFSLGMPFRTMWYQFGPFEAYYQTGDYDTVLSLAQSNLNDGGGHFVEETFYYGGLAREAMGETQRALSNYMEAARFNPNFSPAIEARDRLQQELNG
ncbi:C39 family peptidase [Phototrophicus methaneseepsis]|uniref:C39 family peptidase n=1 Tax=Phototrophicus methaneseepsis TaxID=2710758 RepID=A0A7S8EAL2_9CHLR|nr:C39 family peptidase [Phototrophicus methaneseepsis]QPC83402.1 C39 family peptidase [Phototrophicus methaneseepsis]